MKNLNFLFVFFLFLTSYVHAQNNFFTGAVNNAWNNANNWSTGSVPTASQYVYINDAKSAVISGSVTVKNINMYPGSSLTINSGATVNLIGDGAPLNSIDIHRGSTLTNNGTINVMDTNGDPIYGLWDSHLAEPPLLIMEPLI